MSKQIKSEDEWIAEWVRKLNKLGAEMDEIGDSMHPSGWDEALAPHREQYRKLAAQSYKPGKAKTP